MQNIITNRLTLRAIKSKDIFSYSELFSDKETMKLIGGLPLTNDLDIKNVIYQIKKEEDEGISIFWTITLSNEKEFIGFVRLMNYNSIYYDLSFDIMGDLKNSPLLLKYIDRKNGWEIDYALLKDHRNQGIMTEALSAVQNFCIENKLSPIYAKVNNIENKATISVLLKTNFFELIPQTSNEGGLGMIYKWEIINQ